MSPVRFEKPAPPLPSQEHGPSRMAVLCVLLSNVFALPSPVFAQDVIEYKLDGGFTATTAAAPALAALGTGRFEDDTVPAHGALTRKVYRFDKGSGLSFDNARANAFIDNDYAIELYFKFDDLASWKRIIDFKNRKSDTGLYAFNNLVQFFRVATSREAPFAPRRYAHLVFTRSVRDTVRVYVDSALRIEFHDGAGLALLDDENMLNVFQDDRVIPNEASSGTIALLRIYNFALTGQQVGELYEDVSVSTEAGEAELPTAPILRQNYPNPFNPTTSIPFAISEPATVRLSVHDVLGRQVGVLVEGYHLAGAYTYPFDARHLPSGLYLYRLEAGRHVLVRRMLLVD